MKWLDRVTNWSRGKWGGSGAVQKRPHSTHQKVPSDTWHPRGHAPASCDHPSDTWHRAASERNAREKRPRPAPKNKKNPANQNKIKKIKIVSTIYFVLKNTFKSFEIIRDTFGNLHAK